MKTISADYFDGRSSDSRPATIRLEGDQVFVTFEGNGLNYRLEQVRLTDAVGSIPRSLMFPDGGVCQLHDAGHAALFERQPGGTGLAGRLHRLEIRPAAVLTLLLAGILLVSGCIMFGIPWLAKRAAFAMPPLLEQRLDRESLVMLDRFLVQPSTLPPERRQHLQMLFRRVTTSLPQELPYRLEFRRGAGLGANALALPGGTVMLTDELAALAQNDTELLGVIAHELTHIRNRHAMRSLLQSSATALLVAAVTGDVTSITALAATLPTVLAEARYSRDFEREADDGAVAWLRRQNLPVQPYAELLARLQAQLTAKNGARPETGKLRNYLSTHPDTAERIRRIIRQP